MIERIPLLDSLRPLREPPPPESIAPIVVMAILGILLAALLVWAATKLAAKRQRVRRAAETELALSRHLAPPERLAAQAHLLRRLALTTAGEGEARQHGEPWLAQLDRLFATSFFSEGDGRVYGAALYSPGLKPDVDGLDRTLAMFIAKVRR